MLTNSSLTLYFTEPPIQKVDVTFVSGKGIKQSMLISIILLLDFQPLLASTLSLEHPSSWKLSYGMETYGTPCIEKRKIILTYDFIQKRSYVLP